MIHVNISKLIEFNNDFTSQVTWLVTDNFNNTYGFYNPAVFLCSKVRSSLFLYFCGHPMQPGLRVLNKFHHRPGLGLYWASGEPSSISRLCAVVLLFSNYGELARMAPIRSVRYWAGTCPAENVSTLSSATLCCSLSTLLCYPITWWWNPCNVAISLWLMFFLVLCYCSHDWNAGHGLWK